VYLTPNQVLDLKVSRRRTLRSTQSTSYSRQDRGGVLVDLTGYRQHVTGTTNLLLPVPSLIVSPLLVSLMASRLGIGEGLSGTVRHT
jgi:hypothetical protein